MGVLEFGSVMIGHFEISFFEISGSCNLGNVGNSKWRNEEMKKRKNEKMEKRRNGEMKAITSFG